MVFTTEYTEAYYWQVRTPAKAMNGQISVEGQPAKVGKIKNNEYLKVYLLYFLFLLIWSRIIMSFLVTFEIPSRISVKLISGV